MLPCGEVWLTFRTRPALMPPMTGPNRGWAGNAQPPRGSTCENEQRPNGPRDAASPGGDGRSSLAGTAAPDGPTAETDACRLRPGRRTVLDAGRGRPGRSLGRSAASVPGRGVDISSLGLNPIGRPARDGARDHRPFPHPIRRDRMRHSGRPFSVATKPRARGCADPPRAIACRRAPALTRGGSASASGRFPSASGPGTVWRSWTGPFRRGSRHRARTSPFPTERPRRPRAGAIARRDRGGWPWLATGPRPTANPARRAPGARPRSAAGPTGCR